MRSMLPPIAIKIKIKIVKHNRNNMQFPLYKKEIIVQIHSNVNLVLQLANITRKAGLYSSHRERSHHGFYNGVGGLYQTVVPVGIQDLALLALGVVVSRA